MTHRHLLPNEIDLLIDGEVGFGVAPLRAHIEECEGCRARLGTARKVVERLEDLPRFAPKPRFADRVLASVHVVQPWHVAVLEGARLAVPRSRGLRVLAAASAAVLATGFSLSVAWLAYRADFALYAFNLFADRARGIALAGAGSLLSQALGPNAVDAVRTGGPLALLAAAAIALGSLGAATLAFRAFAASSRRARE